MRCDDLIKLHASNIMHAMMSRMMRVLVFLLCAWCVCVCVCVYFLLLFFFVFFSFFGTPMPIRTVRERERVCVCERERESVCERERECVCVCFKNDSFWAKSVVRSNNNKNSFGACMCSYSPVGLSADSMALNFDTASFTDNYLQLIADAQSTRATGDIPDVVPFMRYGNDPADPSWSDALPTLVYVRYAIDGDLTPASLFWDQLLEYMQNLADQLNKAGGMVNWRGSYGDWVPAKASDKPSTALTNANAYINGVQHMMELADALGKDMTPWATLKSSLIEQLNKAFYHADTGCWDNCGQSSYAIALSTGAAAALGSNVTDTAVKQLVTNIVSTNLNHVTVGIIGAKLLFPMLTAHAQHEVAVSLAEQVSYPSWGYMLYNPTEPAVGSIWELWNAPTQGPGMNSRNHHMFSSLSQWLIQSVGGLSGVQPTHEGTCQAKITMRAAAALGVSQATTRIASPRTCAGGDIEWMYQRHGGIQCLKVLLGACTSFLFHACILSFVVYFVLAVLFCRAWISC